MHSPPRPPAPLSPPACTWITAPPASTTSARTPHTMPPAQVHTHAREVARAQTLLRLYCRADESGDDRRARTRLGRPPAPGAWRRPIARSRAAPGRGSKPPRARGEAAGMDICRSAVRAWGWDGTTLNHHPQASPPCQPAALIWSKGKPAMMQSPGVYPAALKSAIVYPPWITSQAE